jgi:hypothetical protein
MSQDWKQLRAQSDSAEFPASMDNARKLLIRAYEEGSVDTTKHIQQRAVERNFTTVDVENVVRNGSFVGKPKLSPDHQNWCFKIRGKIEGKTLEVRVGLDPGIDFDSPLLVLITGIRKGGPNAKHYGENDKDGGDDYP